MQMLTDRKPESGATGRLADSYSRGPLVPVATSLGIGLVAVLSTTSRVTLTLAVGGYMIIGFLLSGSSGPSLLTRTQARRLIAGLAVSSPLLAAPWVPAAIPMTLSLLFVAGTFLALLASRPFPQQSNRVLLAGLLGPAVLVVALVPRREGFAVLAMGGFALALAAARIDWSVEQRVKGIAWAMLAYLGANVIAWLASEPWAAPARAGTDPGWDSALSGTVGFPLAMSWADTAVAAAALGALAAVLLAKGPRQHAWVWALIVLLSLAVMVLNRARLPLVLCIGVAVAALLVPQALARWSPILPVGALLMPFWWPWLTERGVAVVQAASTWTTWLDEYGSSQRLQVELPSLNGRTVFWTGSRRTLEEASIGESLLGWGWLSGEASGAAQRYEVLIEQYRESLTRPGDDFFPSLVVVPPLPEPPEPFIHHSAHSVLLQTWLDIGLLGAIYVVVLVVIAVMLARRHVLAAPSPHASALLAAIVVMVLSTGIEQMLVPIAFHVSWWLFLMMVAVAAQPPEHQTAGDAPAPNREGAREAAGDLPMP